ncbi:unnamed protein product [Amoebophrya sp. A120]|nr:unnamed protein product [Amoebophrya sp. A120]|eukprot:GSA120T00013231001.1
MMRNTLNSMPLGRFRDREAEEAEEDMDFEEILAINEREQTAQQQQQQNRTSTASNSGNNNNKPKVFRSFLKGTTTSPTSHSPAAVVPVTDTEANAEQNRKSTRSSIFNAISFTKNRTSSHGPNKSHLHAPGGTRSSIIASLVPSSFSRTSLAGAQSFVTSESFVKRICSYDESALRARPSPNDALRRAATQRNRQKKTNNDGTAMGKATVIFGTKGIASAKSSSGPGGAGKSPNHAQNAIAIQEQRMLQAEEEIQNTWTFAVKCMKKAALIEEEKKKLESFEKRMQAISKMLQELELNGQQQNPELMNNVKNLLQVPGAAGGGAGGDGTTEKQSSRWSVVKKISVTVQRPSALLSVLRISNSSNANAAGASPGGIAGSKREPHLGLGDSNLNLISENGTTVMMKQSTASQMKQSNSPLNRRQSQLSAGLPAVNLRSPMLLLGGNYVSQKHRQSATIDFKTLKDNIFEGNFKIFKTALEKELKELTIKRKETSKELKSLKSVSEAAVLKELKLLALCRHKNILYLVEAFEDTKFMYVVVERCYGDFTTRYGAMMPPPAPVTTDANGNNSTTTGNNNSHFLGPPAVESVVKHVIFQVLQALQHMHKLLVLHRDIKPENVLFKNPPVRGAQSLNQQRQVGVQQSRRDLLQLNSPSASATDRENDDHLPNDQNAEQLLHPDIVLGDFGMALQMQHRNSVCTDLAGSAAFLAPESWSDSVQQFKSDIWAVGVMQYEMVYGTLPYHTSSHPEFFKNQYQKSTSSSQANQPEHFCDLAYKLGTVGLKLATTVVSPETSPYYGEKSSSGETVNQQCQNVMQIMLTKDAALRRSAAQCLALPWFRGKQDEEKGGAVGRGGHDSSPGSSPGSSSGGAGNKSR